MIRTVDVRRLTWLFCLVAIIRGLDYVTGNDSRLSRAILNPAGPELEAPRSALVGVETAAPLWIWGVLLLVPAYVVLVCVTVRRIPGRHTLIWCGHVALSAVYLGLTVGLGVGYIDRPWLDGIRSASGLLVPTGVHALLWWRMGWRPSAGH